MKEAVSSNCIYEALYKKRITTEYNTHNNTNIFPVPHLYLMHLFFSALYFRTIIPVAFHHSQLSFKTLLPKKSDSKIKN